MILIVYCEENISHMTSGYAINIRLYAQGWVWVEGWLPGAEAGRMLVTQLPIGYLAYTMSKIANTQPKRQAFHASH
jgi:hypothetical protein